MKRNECVPELLRVGAAGPVLLEEGRGVAIPGTGAGEGVVGLTRPSKPGMAELGMLKLSCSRCLPEPAAQQGFRPRWAGVGIFTSSLNFQQLSWPRWQISAASAL